MRDQRETKSTRHNEYGTVYYSKIVSSANIYKTENWLQQRETKNERKDQMTEKEEERHTRE